MVTYKLFEPFAEILAFTTTREDLSHGKPRFTGKDPDIYMPMRKTLAELLDLDSCQMVFPEQTHSDHIRLVTKKDPPVLKESDALVTSQKNLCLCIQTADCVPVLVYDPHEKVIAAIHAGWRGTLNRITAKTIEKMKMNFSCSPDNLYAVIGPSIGPEIYETGMEVATLFKSQSDNWPDFLILQGNGRYHIDLWNANRYQLEQQGVSNSRIQLLQQCTFHRQDLYYSARRDGTDTGRMVSGIMMRQ